MIPRPGLLLGGRYSLTERIAVGGMGEVWRGTDTVLDRPVAVKVLRADLDRDGPFLARFRAEARTAAMLSHPGIAAMYDFQEEENGAYLVMELVPGEPLSTIISRDGALGIRRTLDVVSQTATALQVAHSHGVVHRDVKPANLIVTPQGQVKVTDFGIARPQDHEPLTATGQVMGTAHYLAPEVARGNTATPASDVYALGIVMYECLAGRRPFDGANQVAVATAQLFDEAPPLPETIPAPVRGLVSQAMAKHPADRPGSAAAFAAAAQRLAEDPNRPLPRAPGRTQQSRTAPPQSRTAPPTSQAPQDPGTTVPPTAQIPLTPSSAPMTGSPRHGPRRDARAVVRGRRRSLRSPLIALIALVILVAIGALISRGARSGGLGYSDSTDVVAGSGTPHSQVMIYHTRWVSAQAAARRSLPSVDDHLGSTQDDEGWHS